MFIYAILIYLPAMHINPHLDLTSMTCQQASKPESIAPTHLAGASWQFLSPRKKIQVFHMFKNIIEVLFQNTPDIIVRNIPPPCCNPTPATGWAGYVEMKPPTCKMAFHPTHHELPGKQSRMSPDHPTLVVPLSS